MKWKIIVENAEKIKKGVEKNKKIPTITGYNLASLCYIFGEAVKKPGKEVVDKKITNCPNCTGTNIAKNLTRNEYVKLATNTNKYMLNHNNTAPNYTSYQNYKVSIKLQVYCYAKIIVWYNEHKNTLPNTCWFKNEVFSNVKTTSTTTSSSSKTTNTTTSTTNCTNPYTSKPHHTNQGAGYLGQTTGYRCGPHSLMQGFRKFGWDLSESKLASVAGTTTSGTGHSGLETAIAWVAKQKNVKLNVTWKNFSDFGSSNTARFKSIGKLACKSDTFVFFHIGYEDSGSAKGSEVFGHYEMCDKYNVETSYVRALNSLGSKQGSGYYGHLQDRSFSLQAYYISNISQKSVCIVTKG